MALNPFRIIFMGTPAFAVPSLKALLDHGEKIAAVVTQPDRPKGRGRKLTPPPVKEAAISAGLPVFQPEKIKGQDFLAQLRDFQPDLIIVAAYGRILPSPLLHMPRLGTLNVHGSILPKYRGAAPIQWALLNGESETGVTIMQMDEGMDTGDILLTKRIPITNDDTSGSLLEKLSKLGGRALAEALDLLRANRLFPVKQDDSQASAAPLLTKDMGRIDWSWPAARIGRFIRGLDPWPTAYTSLAGKRLRLFKPEVVEQASIDSGTAEASSPCAAGTVRRADDEGLLICTGRDFLLIKEIQPEGGRRMPVSAFLRGHPLPVDQQLGDPVG
jgi:methionyl-tRNA formyltransferase